MDAVRAADHHRVAMFLGALSQGREEVVDLLEDQLAGLLALDGQGRVQQVAAGHAQVDPATVGADVLGHVGQEGDDVVVRDRLDLEHAVGIEVGLRGDRPGGLGRDLTQVGEGLACGDLDVAPDLETPPIGPKGLHFRGLVPLDHECGKVAQAPGGR